MYGYDLPRYAKEYAREWRKYDRFLRLRWSLDEPGRYILERKTVYVSDHPFTRGTDKQVQLKDGYRRVLTFNPNEIHRVAEHLRFTDLQRMGANALSHLLREEMDTEDARLDKDRMNEFEALGSEAFDFLAWREGRKVSLGGHSVSEQ